MTTAVCKACMHGDKQHVRPACMATNSMQRTVCHRGSMLCEAEASACSGPWEVATLLAGLGMVREIVCASLWKVSVFCSPWKENVCEVRVISFLVEDHASLPSSCVPFQLCKQPSRRFRTGSRPQLLHKQTTGSRLNACRLSCENQHTYACCLQATKPWLVLKHSSVARETCLERDRVRRTGLRLLSRPLCSGSGLRIGLRKARMGVSGPWWQQKQPAGSSADLRGNTSTDRAWVQDSRWGSAVLSHGHR